LPQKGEELKKLILFGIVLLILVGCTAKEKPSKPTIFVSILPQKYFVERLVSDEFEVEVMVPPGQSPATYEPTPQQMVALSNAVLYFKIGVPFEQSWLDKIAELNPDLIFVDTAAGIELREMASLAEIIETEIDTHAEEHHAEEHHAEDQNHDDHDHEGAMDPHIWLSPELVKIQADNILSSLTELKPERKDVYELRNQSFKLDLEELQQEIMLNFSNLKNRELLVFHPSWGYFAKEFGLQQIPIEISGKAPTSRELTKIMKLAKDREIKVIFVQKQFSKHEAEMVADNISGTVVQIDPLAENYLDNMSSISKHIQESLNR